MLAFSRSHNKLIYFTKYSARCNGSPTKNHSNLYSSTPLFFTSIPRSRQANRRLLHENGTTIGCCVGDSVTKTKKTARAHLTTGRPLLRQSRDRRGRGNDRISTTRAEPPLGDSFLHVRRDQVLDLGRVDLTRAAVTDLCGEKRIKRRFFNPNNNGIFIINRNPLIALPSERISS